MDLKTLLYNLREEVSCSVCSDVYANPKHLSCLHSFCLKCLQRWYKTCGGGKRVRCPNCQTFSRVPASGDLKDLPTSFFLNGLIDVLAIKECKKTQVTCGNCDKKSSEASYCFQCCIFYCEECLIGHNVMRDKKDHRVLALKEFQDKDYEDVLKRPVFCSSHTKDELKLFCKECEKPVCQTCVMLDHSGHKLKLIEEEAETQKIDIKTIIQTQRSDADENKKAVAQLVEDYAKVIQQSENVIKDVQGFADGLIEMIQAKKLSIITAVENQTKKSLESLTTKMNEIQHQIHVVESALEEAEKHLNRSSTAEVVHLKGSLQTIFEEIDQVKPIADDFGTFVEAFVFIKNQKILDIVNEEHIGSLEVPCHTKPGESLAEGEGLKEGTVGRKAKFNLITRNAERKQGYDKRDLVTLDINDENERECLKEVQIDDNKDGIYNISYYPTVKGTHELLVKVNGEYIHGSPFTVIVKPFHVEAISSFEQKGSGDGMFLNPFGVAVSDTDKIVVTDNKNHQVQVFDNSGTILRSFGRHGKNAGEFNTPMGVSVDRNIYVAESGNHRVQILSWDGRHLGSFGGQGSLDSQLSDPWGLSLDSTGNVIVADAGNKLIKIFTPDGKFVRKIGGQGSFSYPIHCVQCGEYFIVSDHGEHCIKVFNNEGKFQCKFGRHGGGDGELNYPGFLSVTQSKLLLVCDTTNHRIQVFKLDGEFVGKFGTLGSELGEFHGPFSVAVLSNDQIVVCDENNHRIQIFE